MGIEMFKIVEKDGTIREPQRTTCEYKGIMYFIHTDRELKRRYIQTDSGILWLDKNGNVASKQLGKFSTVDFLTVDEIKRMKSVFLGKVHDAKTPTNQLIAWRNYTIFVCGINVGLRASDLRQLKWKDIYMPGGNRKVGYTFKAQKTGKRTEIGLNDAFFEAMENYYEKNVELKEEPNINDYIFISKKKKSPINEKQMWAIIDTAGKEAHINKNLGSHTLRKTFGRNIYNNATDKEKALIMLQEWFKHGSPMTTLRYIGITFDDLYEMANSIHL